MTEKETSGTENATPSTDKETSGTQTETPGTGEAEPGTPGNVLAGAAAAARIIRQRPTRLQIVVLGLISLMAFGPVIAAIAVARTDEGPVTTLIEGPPTPDDGARVVVTLTGVTATAGEMRARLVIQLGDQLLSNGRPTTDLELRVNDVRGASTYDFPRGEPLRPFDITLALQGGSVVRYPFDRYDSGLSIVLTGEGPGGDPLLFSLDVLSNVDEFDVTAPGSENVTQPTGWAVVELDVDREATTTAYAVWMMVLMWGLSIAGVMIVWAVTIWRVELPFWAFGYLVGVLFALPPLRDQLPGRPPPGTLLDFVAFYWSIAIVGVTLIAVLMLWLQGIRPKRDPGRDGHAD